jgi:hypothetical protein
MGMIQRTLWDLLLPKQRARPKRPAPERSIAIAPPPPRAPVVVEPPARPKRPVTTPMQERYDHLVREMKARYGLRVRKWRSSSSGCAWEVEYSDGRRVKLIESPYPRGPMSCAIFLHEVGHHAIGLGRYRPRCLEEYHAWAWSLEMMRTKGLNVTRRVEERMAESLHYAVLKARRRGLKRLPVELAPYVDRPAHLKR